MKIKNEIVKADEIDFHGQTLLTAKIDDEILVAMKPIVEGMGLDWMGQYKKIKASKRYGHMYHGEELWPPSHNCIDIN